MENFVSESSSHEDVESVLIWKLSGEASSFKGVKDVSMSDGMALFRDTGDETLVARIFGGVGR